MNKKRCSSFVFLFLTQFVFSNFLFSASISVNYNNNIKSFNRIFAFGNNVACWGGWQKYVKHKEMIEASGSCYFVRYPGGSTSNQYHWNGEGVYDEKGIWHPSSTTFKTGFICWPLNNGTRYDSYGEGEPSKIMDNDLNTSWISFPGLNTPQYVYFNFGSQKTCNKIVIHWGDHYAVNYKIQYWSAGSWPWPYNAEKDNWVDIITVNNSTGGVQIHTFSSINRQIFRILMLESSSDRYEIKEVYFYNNDVLVSVNTNNYRTQTDCIASSMFPSNYKRPNQWIPDFDFERFMEWCRSFTRGKVYPIITINMGTGTPEEAAAWVYYANVVKGYGIKYWEINNEISGHWEIGGPISAKDYAQIAIKFIEAMKSVDPSIEVIVTGGCSPEEWSHSYDGKRYIEGFLEYFNSIGKANFVDIVGCHWYPYWQNSDETVALSKTELWDIWGPMIKSWINNYLPDPSRVKISISEYSSGGATANTCKLMEALFTVDWVLNFIKNGGDMTNKWDVFNGLGVGPDGTYGDHAFMENGMLTGEYEKYAYQPRSSYWALFMLYNLFSSSATNTLVEAISDTNTLKVYANKREDNVLSVIVINKDPQNPCPASVNILGFNPQLYANVYTFDSNNYIWHEKGINSYADPSDPPTVSTIVVSSQFSYTFPPYSITLINLYKANAKIDENPKVTFLAPVKNQKVSGNFLVKVKATDDNSIKLIQLYIDNILVAYSSDGDTSLEYLWDTTRYYNGKHFLRAICYDNLNQIGIIQIDCIVDNQIDVFEYLIDDCEDGDTRNILGGHWFNYDDRGSGGNSSVSPYPFEMSVGGVPGLSAQYCAYMSWSLGSAIQYPYVGLGMNFIDNSVYDLSEYDGISFYFKGNQNYQLAIRMPQDGTDNGWASYRVQFSSSSEWVKKVFYWQDFHLPSWSPNKEEDYPLDLTKIQNIIFMPAEGLTAGASGEIFIDNIYLIKKITSPQQSNKYKLIVEINPENSGRVEVEPESVDGYYLKGTSVTLKAIPNHGWVFKNWSGDVETTQNPVVIIVDSTKTIIASFEILQDTIFTPVVLRKKYLLTFDNDGKNDVVEFGNSIEAVKVYDIKGNLVYETKNRIDASSKLKVGVYIYKAKFKDGNINVGSIQVLK